PGRSVNRMVAEALPATARLAAVTVGLALLLGVPLGVLSAVGRASLADVLARLVAVGGMSLPSFVVAVVLIRRLALRWHVVAVARRGRPAPLRPAGARAAGPAARLHHARDAGRRAARPAGGLRAHGPRQGPVAVAGTVAPRLAERRRLGDHDRGARLQLRPH